MTLWPRIVINLKKVFMKPTTSPGSFFFSRKNPWDEVAKKRGPCCGTTRVLVFLYNTFYKKAR